MFKLTQIFAIVVVLIASVTWFALARNQKTEISGAIADAIQSTQSSNTSSDETATAILAGGCFWCVEADFDKLSGVKNVVSGYSGGTAENPTYENYADSGHVEVVKISYDPAQVTYAGLIEWLIKHSDPTDGEGSFGDRGAEYRPVIYFESDTEQTAADQVIEKVNELGVYEKSLAIDVEQRKKFWPAEGYHQDYHSKSLVKYDFYRYRSGRDAFIEKHWGERAAKLELPGSVPEVAAAAEGSIAETGSSTERPWIGFTKPSQPELKQNLSAAQYTITQEEGTERPFQNEYWDNQERGIYVDVVSGEPLFSSLDKYKSGTGWPSFVRPLDSQFIKLLEDKHLLSTRTEVRSKIADSHLGHVFDDGPSDRGGKRWCMNSAAMKFVPMDEMATEGYGEFLNLLGSDKEQ